jgi:EpsI family protein
MRYGTGYDHIVFGRILFLAVILVVFWIGQRWRDTDDSTVAPPGHVTGEAPPRRIATAVVAACIVLIVGTPWYLSVARARADARRAPLESSLAMPSGHGPWQGPRDTAGSWRPPYSGALLERAATYVDDAGSTVDLYVGVYELGGTGDGEMISYRNRLYPQEHRSLLAERAVSPPTGGGRPLRAREFVLPGPSGDRLVWYWFMIGEEITPNRNVAKALEAVALISGEAGYGRVVTLATQANDLTAARRRLAAFALEYGTCARGGFVPQVCGR